MSPAVFIFLTIIVGCCNLLFVPVHGDDCYTVSSSEGQIRLNNEVHIENHEVRYGKCWEVPVSEDQYTRLSFTSFDLAEKGGCLKGYVKIQVEDHEDEIFCHSEKTRPITALKTVKIHYSRQDDGQQRSWVREDPYTDRFKISFKTEDLLCLDKSSFRCSPHSCVRQSQVCDGTRDCTNGKDELDCAKGIAAVSYVSVIKSKGVGWLKGLRQASWGWGSNTPRAIVALHLAGGLDFNGAGQEVELMAKQLELMMALALLRNGTDSLAISELGMYLHALLVTCHDPRHFYGFDLVRLLEQQLGAVPQGAHPVAALALCNARGKVSDCQVRHLVELLDSDSDHPFLPDVQAMAVMALNCIIQQGNHSDAAANITVSVNHFKSLQLQDGSFGNVYTTALIIQALLASGQELDTDWKLKAAVEYLKTQQKEDSSFGDVWASYLVLPILNAKTLTDVANVNCSINQRKSREAKSLSEIESKLGPKMHVQYSLHIGDELDVVHSLSMRVPSNITAFEVMRLAAEADAKYKYESRIMSGKVYVYSMAGITNDSENGKFWLLYLSDLQSNGTANPVVKREHLMPEFKKINPFQKVPVLEHEGFVLTESIAMIRYLSREFSVADHWYPKDSKSQARVDEYLEWQHLNTRLFGSMIFRQRVTIPLLENAPVDNNKINFFKKNFENVLDQIQEGFLKDRSYLCGSQISVADIFAACEIEQPLLIGYDPLSSRPKMISWFENVKKELAPHYGEVHDVTKIIKNAIQGGKL